MALGNSPGYFQPIGEALDNILISLFRYNGILGMDWTENVSGRNSW